MNNNIVPGAPAPPPLSGHHHHVFPDLHQPPPPLPFRGVSFLHHQPQPHLPDDIDPSNPKPPASSNTHPLSRKKRNLPDPDAEVIALSPKTLMATNRFVCEICNKGFQRDQNLQLHRRGHNLPWKLKQRSTHNKDGQPVKKKVYVCPEKSCAHHDPSRALGDLTGIKKHFSRKHGEKKWKCDKCSKKYAVQSDWKAHSKTCGTREYKCDCGTLFSRKDSFITHRAFCDALAEESARQLTAAPACGLSFKNDPDPIMMNRSTTASGGVMGGHGILDAAGISPLGPIFRSDYTAIGAGNPLGFSDHQMIQMMQMSSANLFGSTTASILPNLIGLNNDQFPNITDRIATGGAAATTPPLGILKEEVLEASSSNDHRLLIRHHGHGSQGNRIHEMSSSSTPAPMSATALLHKAAQLGSSSWSNINPATIFGNYNSFGVTGMGAPSIMSSGVAATPASTSGPTGLDHQLIMNIMRTPRGGSIRLTNDGDDGAAHDHERQAAAARPSKILDQSSGFTRDFLGMSGDDNIDDRQGGRPFLPLELANYASMNSDMDLSQFTGSCSK